MMLLDTCFLIDLQREFQSGERGPARTWMEANAQDTFALSVISLTEFLEGFAEPESGERLLRPFRWLPVNAAVARAAGRIRRGLRMDGKLIGDFDILIGATALAAGLPLVTRDFTHFHRIAGLELLDYTRVE